MLGYSILLFFGVINFAHCMKLAADSAQAIAVNRATLGNDTVISEPYFPGIGIPEDVQNACGKFENPQQQFSRVTEQRNDSVDFGQFLQLDSCATAWRKHDFMKIDTNNDSKISADEWNAHNEKLRKDLEEAILQQKNYTFNRIDGNADGLLSKKELKKYLDERLINTQNLTKYLNGSQLNFAQFSTFDSSIPNATFPFFFIAPIYDYAASYTYDDDDDVVDPMPMIKPQPRPAILPAGPAISIMPFPAVASPPNKDAQMNIQIDPPVGGALEGPSVMKPAVMPIGGGASAGKPATDVIKTAVMPIGALVTGKPASIPASFMRPAVMPAAPASGGLNGQMSAAVMPQ